MKTLARAAAVLVVILSMLLVCAPGKASAHPMGNFSINHYSAITVGSGQITILYIVDMAEIPTFQDLGAIRADHSTNLSQAEHDAYMGKKTSELLGGLHMTIDGNPVTLKLEKSQLTFPAGAGGLPTTRIEMHLSAPAAQSGTLQYSDDNFLGRAGWKDIVANAAPGMSLVESSVGKTDVTNGLTKYPTDISGPPSVVAATVKFSAGAGAAGTVQTQGSGSLSSTLGWAQGRADALTDLIAQKDLPLGALLVGMLVAFVLGAGHALSPGHGKTVVAAYLVGSKGTASHAALLGVTVTLSHTIGVFLLGVVVLYAENYILPETLYPWLGFVSGLGIAIMGVGLFFQRYRGLRRAEAREQQAALTSGAHSHDGHTHDDPDHSHDHEHSHHDHGHEHNGHYHVHASTHEHSHDDSHSQSHGHGHEHGHGHDHEHEHTHDSLVPHKHGMFGRAHTHLPADGQSVSIKSLLALGITGGIIPCPSALVVLLVAVASHRVGLGLVLIVAFSLGLAAVLTGIGLLMVYGRGLLSRFKFGGTGLIGRLPVASALAVACLGLAIAYEALRTGGIIR